MKEAVQNILNTLIGFDEPVKAIFAWIGVIIALALIGYTIWSYKEIGRFFQTTLAELRKVEWLNRRDIRIFTIANIGFIIVLSAVIFGLDQLFTTLRTLII